MIVILPNPNAFTNAQAPNWVALMRGKNGQSLGSGQSVECATGIAATGDALSIKNGKSIGLSDDCRPNSEPSLTTLYGQRSTQAHVASSAAYLVTLRAGHLRQHANTIDGKAA